MKRDPFSSLVSAMPQVVYKYNDGPSPALPFCSKFNPSFALFSHYLKLECKDGDAWMHRDSYVVVFERPTHYISEMSLGKMQNVGLEYILNTPEEHKWTIFDTVEALYRGGHDRTIKTMTEATLRNMCECRFRTERSSYPGERFFTGVRVISEALWDGIVDVLKVKSRK